MLNLKMWKIGISSPIFINNSLCAYNKKLWDKYKKLRDNRYVHEFWTSYGLIKIKVSKCAPPVTITQAVDLENCRNTTSA